MRAVEGTLTKHDLERAVVTIDAFPRCALVLSIFEEVSMQDAAILLDADPALIRKAQGIGLCNLTRNLSSARNGRSMTALAVAPQMELPDARA